MKTELNTPGPWRASGTSIKAVSHGKWFTIARVNVTGYTKEGNEALADFIAAAPDVALELDRLKAYLTQCQNSKPTEEVPIGPNRCFSCGGEYGQHNDHCTL